MPRCIIERELVANSGQARSITHPHLVEVELVHLVDSLDQALFDHLRLR